MFHTNKMQNWCILMYSFTINMRLINIRQISDKEMPAYSSWFLVRHHKHSRLNANWRFARSKSNLEPLNDAIIRTIKQSVTCTAVKLYWENRHWQCMAVKIQDTYYWSCFLKKWKSLLDNINILMCLRCMNSLRWITTYQNCLGCG